MAMMFKISPVWALWDIEAFGSSFDFGNVYQLQASHCEPKNLPTSNVFSGAAASLICCSVCMRVSSPYPCAYFFIVQRNVGATLSFIFVLI